MILRKLLEDPLDRKAFLKLQQLLIDGLPESAEVKVQTSRFEPYIRCSAKLKGKVYNYVVYSDQFEHAQGQPEKTVDKVNAFFINTALLQHGFKNLAGNRKSLIRDDMLYVSMLSSNPGAVIEIRATNYNAEFPNTFTHPQPLIAKAELISYEGVEAALAYLDGMQNVSGATVPTKVFP